MIGMPGSSPGMTEKEANPANAKNAGPVPSSKISAKKPAKPARGGRHSLRGVHRRRSDSPFAQPLEMCNFRIAPIPVRTQNFDAIADAFIANVDLRSGDQFFHFVLAFAAK